MTTLDVRSQLFEAIQAMRLGGSASSPRPHKPLLLLLAFSRAERGAETAMTFAEVRAGLTPLLATHGGSHSSPRPAQPFWRLQRDGLWVVAGASDLPRTSAGDVLARYLTDKNVGDFPVPIGKLIQTDAAVRREAVDLTASRLVASFRHQALGELGLLR